MTNRHTGRKQGGWRILKAPASGRSATAPDDNANEHAAAVHRRSHPPANHAAEAVVIYDLQRQASDGLASFTRVAFGQSRERFSDPYRRGGLPNETAALRASVLRALITGFTMQEQTKDRTNEAPSRSNEAIIGRAFGWSVLAFLVVTAAGIGGAYVWNYFHSTPKTIVEAKVASPKQVAQYAVAAPRLAHFTDVTQQAGITFSHNNDAYGEKLPP